MKLVVRDIVARVLLVLLTTTPEKLFENFFCCGRMILHHVGYFNDKVDQIRAFHQNSVRLDGLIDLSTTTRK